MKINNQKVKPVKLEKVDNSKVKGIDMFDLLCNIFICARKKTGKTTIIYNILKNCANKKTKIVIICPTVNKDPTYLKIQEDLKKKGNEILTFTSIKDSKTDNLNDILDVLIEESEKEQIELTLRNDAEDDKKNEHLKPMIPMFQYGEGKSEQEKKERKPSKIAPEIIFILDDLSRELRFSSVARLLKMHRHFKSKVIISTQYPNDLAPESIKQMDYVLLLKNHTSDKLEELYSKLDLSIDYEQFLEYYYTATEDDYGFLYINVTTGEFRKNFNYRFND